MGDRKFFNCVSFEIFPEICEDDFDLLILYLSNRKQSGGGDIMNIESLTFSLLEDKKKFKISYEDTEVSKRMIEKKFFKFKNYFIRSFEPSVSSYKEEKYDLLSSKLILKNIDSQDDDSIVQMYAEHLAPDNDVLSIQKSHLFPDTFYIIYKDNLNKESVLTRYHKKPKLRNKDITIMDVYDTYSLIAFFENRNTNDFTQIIHKVNSEIIEKNQNYFLDVKKKFVFFQFENEKILNDMFDLIKRNVNQSGIVVEKVFNFDLLSDEIDVAKSDLIPQENMVVLPKKFVDVGIQTEKLQEEKIESTIPLSKLSLNGDEKFKRNSQAPSVRSSFSESSSCVSSNFSTNSKFDPFILLDMNEYYSIALINSKQLFLNFQEELRKIDKKLELKYTQDQLRIRNFGFITSNDWKMRVMTALNVFFDKRASFNLIKIPDEILTNPISMGNLSCKLSEYNKISSAYYLRIIKPNIECYGCKRVLNDKVIELTDFLKSLKNSIPNVSTIKNEIPKENNSNSKLSNLNSNDKFEIYSDRLVYEALWNLRQIMVDFKNSIKTLNADIQIENKDKKLYLIQIVKPDPDWSTKVRSYLDDFEKNKIKKTFIKIPTNLNGPKDIENLKNQFLIKYEKKNPTVRVELINNSVRFVGYVKAVDKFLKETENWFKSSEANAKQRIANKLKIVINRTYHSIEYEILKNFGGKYFQELSDALLKVHASLAAYHIDERENGFRILCNFEKEDRKNENKIDEWSNKIMQCKKQFFDKFVKKTVTLPNGKVGPFKIDFDKNQAFLNWVSDKSVEVIGIKSEVNKLVEKLVEKPTASSDELSSSKPILAKSREQKEDTFLINDLHWFQTRILFEKQYFKYLADNFKNLNVLLDTQLTRICFTGSKDDIEKAKTLAFDILGSILGAEVECELATLNKMTQNENLFVNMLKEKILCCVVDAKSHKDRYTIYATDMEDIEKCQMILSKIKF
ncbi:unnamed protein product [Brachionus calyciflorus]|uniref:Uncharacterized protein n=1 Tax=Brachionus calyciflorus TaxID=104777 RepID=A0A813MHY3_9BILA|nr:unnamed protein product [Brachionus calyciflorus]